MIETGKRDLKQAIRTRKLREERRKIRSILKAAQKVFYAHGYLKTTMDDIALEAGMSKPLIYKRFKSKDDLYFSLMLPVFDDSLAGLNAIESKLEQHGYASGAELIHDVFECIEHCFQVDPDAFNILQLFQHTGMVWELNDEVRSTLFARGRMNYVIGRRIATVAIEQGLFKKNNPFHIVDTVWGGFLGIVRLEDTKSNSRINVPRLKATLGFFEQMVAAAVSA
jgi:AcrR family transcriptional regulator